MIKILLSLFLIMYTNFSFSQSQSEMNKNENIAYQKAEKEINTVYQKILIKYKEDKAFIENLRISQRLWIQFRDAEVNMKFPNNTPGYYGSIYPMCVSNYLTQLTRERTKTLKIWLIGIEEGDACAGSVKTKE